MRHSVDNVTAELNLFPLTDGIRITGDNAELKLNAFYLSTDSEMVYSVDGTQVLNNNLLDNDGEGLGISVLATDTLLSGNVATGNRTDICNCAASTQEVSNTFATGSINTVCIVGRDSAQARCRAGSL